MGEKPGAFTWLENTNENILTFQRSSDSESLLFVGNLSNTTQTSELSFSGKFVDVLSGTEVLIEPTMQLEAWQYFLIKKP